MGTDPTHTLPKKDIINRRTHQAFERTFEHVVGG